MQDKRHKNIQEILVEPDTEDESKDCKTCKKHEQVHSENLPSIEYQMTPITNGQCAVSLTVVGRTLEETERVFLKLKDID